MLKVAGGFLAILFLCNHANACLNDRSLPERESEFRSQYESQYTSQVEQPQEQLFSEGPILPAIGISMLVLAVPLTLFGAHKNG